MTEVKKSGASQQVRPVTADDLVKINRFALTALAAEDVFTFSVNACDTQVDRDWERFSKASLHKLAELFVGKTVIFDHQWSAGNQTARIYDAQVVQEGEVCRLRVDLYMLMDEETQGVRNAICGGILREVSVGCAVRRAVCSVCGEDYGTCGHRKGESYGGVLCIVVLEDPTDAYELSFVAVPAQRNAGVTKAAGVVFCKSDGDTDNGPSGTPAPTQDGAEPGGEPPPADPADDPERAKQLAQAKARVKLMEQTTNI